MTTRCPDGHESSTDDYCDVCGALLDAGLAHAAPSVGGARPSERMTTPVTTGGTRAGSCPVCATPRGTGDVFCEACGFDFERGTSSASAGRWQVTVTADRAYFDRVATEEMVFPIGLEPRVHVLDADEVTIGRGSRSQAVEPGIDLRAHVEDPGVSHRHARLVRDGDGSYAVVDDGSTNGTTINDGDTAIEPGVRVPLRPGDRVHVGAWTTLRVDVVLEEGTA